MKSSKIIIDVDSMYDEINAWKKSIDYFDSDFPSIDKSHSDGFDILKDCGFSDKSFKKFDSTVDNTMFSVREFYSTVLTYLEDMTTSDKEIDAKLPHGKASEAVGTRAVITETAKEPTLKMDDDLDALVDNLVKDDVKKVDFEENYAGVVNGMLGNIKEEEVEKSTLVDNFNKIGKVDLNDTIGDDAKTSTYDDAYVVGQTRLGDIVTDTELKEEKYDDASTITKAALGDVVTDTELKEEKYNDTTNYIEKAQIQDMTKLTEEQRAQLNLANNVASTDLKSMEKSPELVSATFDFNPADKFRG